MSVTSFFSDPDPETNTVDGSVGKSVTGTWTDARNAATGDFVRDNGAGELIIGGTGDIRHNVHLFDTSPLPDGDDISAAKLKLFVESFNDAENDANSFIAVVASTPASDTGLVVADYDQFSTTLFSDQVDITGLTTSAYNDLDFVQAGIDAIIKESISRFGVKEGHPINNDEPSLNTEVQVSMAEASGTSQDPELVVTHAPAAPAIDVVKVGRSPLRGVLRGHLLTR